MVDAVKDIEKLVKKTVGANKKLVRYEIKNATAPGENYAGVMLRIELTFREFGREEVLSGVAKTPNFKVNEFFRDQIPLQYKKEIGFYRDIIPAMVWFYYDEGIGEFPDIFPKLYAGRFNLTEDPELVDENAVILMENLLEQGYQNIDRHVGFDLEGAKRILRDMATFHAVPLAIKIRKSHLFDIKIKKWADARTNFKPPPMDNEPKSSPMQIWLDVLKDYDVSDQHLDVLRKMGPRPSPPAREPFATIGHNDLWTNNTMQVIKNKKIVKNKIIDFQMLDYQSPVKDLLFFLSTSLQFELLDDHFDELIKYYHQEFKKILEKCNCDTEKFEWIQFKKELELEAQSELGHIIMLSIAVFGKKGEKAFDNEAESLMPSSDKISELAKQRVVKLLKIFGGKGWI